MMSFALPSAAPRFGVGAFLRDLDRTAPALTRAGLLFLALMIPTAAALALDPRTLNGVSVWAKPLKFQASIALFFVTLAWAAGALASAVRDGRLYRLGVVAAPIAAGVFEIAYITFQATQGEASHFNTGTPFTAFMYALMGVGAIVLTAGSLILGALVLRRPRAGLDPNLRLAIGLGFVLAFVLGVPTGAVMSAGGGHWVGGVASDAGGLALFGWARDGGDLRVAHFFGLHAQQAIPLAGLVAAAVLPTRAAAASVLVVALAWSGITAWTFAEALAGRPFLPWLG